MSESSEQTEREKLAWVFIEPSTLIDYSEADFLTPSYRTVFHAMVALRNENTFIDITTVADHLNTTGVLQDIDGIKVLARIADTV